MSDVTSTELGINLQNETEKEVFEPHLLPDLIKKDPSLSQGERHGRIKEVIGEVIQNKEDLSIVIRELIGAIRHEPDLPKEELNQKLKKLSTEASLTKDQYELLETGINGYISKHGYIKQIREKYPKDAELFKNLFGRFPKGKVEVMPGPITLYFRCLDPVDYAFVYNKCFQDNRELSKGDIDKSNQTAGFFMKGNLTFENARSKKFDYNSRITKEHEEEHALYYFFNHIKKTVYNAKAVTKVPRFLKKEFDRLIISVANEEEIKTVGKVLENMDDPEERRLFVKRVFSKRRRVIEETRTKDEILAYFQVGEGISDIGQMLLKPEEDGGLYDYFKKEDRLKTASQWVKVLGESWRPLIETTIEQVCVGDYRRILIDNFLSLQNLTNAGFDRNQIVNLLRNEPFEKWDRIARRLVRKKLLRS